MLGEVAFMHKASSFGFSLALPYGHAHAYDFIVDSGSRESGSRESGSKLWRVQVKTTAYKVRGAYRVTICRRGNQSAHAYTASEIDFVAVYIIPDDSWYILPVCVVAGHTTLRFRPSGDPRRDNYGHFREGWRRLREPDGLTFG